MRNNLNTFTRKELKKEIIKIKADKFAVTRMKRAQIIEYPIPPKPKKSDIPLPSIKLDPKIINPAELEGIPPELL